MKSFKDILIELFTDTSIDRNGERHTSDCALRNKKITLINNYGGAKIYEAYRKYCPYCGKKVR